jgi:hypothetical protein
LVSAGSLWLQRLPTDVRGSSELTAAHALVQREPTNPEDNDGSASPTGQQASTSGIAGAHKAVVLNNLDPQNQNRLQVQVPDANIPSVWATPAGASTGNLPAIGDEVTVQFEPGDPDHPTWTANGTKPSTGI